MARPPTPQGGRRVDLHVHTYFSDGALSPEDVIEAAKSRGLAGLAITDHDTLEGVARARAAAGSTLEVVPGVEISSAIAGLEIHVLGYFVDSEQPQLRERLGAFRSERIERARTMIERLAELDVRIDADQVFGNAGPGVVGRPHVARALLDGGHVDSIEEAFRRYLGRSGPAYVARPAFRPDEAIALIHKAGGVSVLAHPGEIAEPLVADMVGAGLHGIEVWHPRHGWSALRYVRRLADKFGLVETGGSDFHGGERATRIGDVSVPVGVLGRLKELAGVAG